jgi:ATP-dependent RNA helicase DeaD
MLCKAGNLTKDDIGAIRVQTAQSFVEIRQASVKQFLTAIGKDRTVEQGAVLTQLDEAPDIANSPRPAFKAKPRHNKFSKDRDQGGHRKGGKPRFDKGDHTGGSDKPKGSGSYKKNWKPEKTRPDGVVEPIKPKRNSDPADKPAKPRKNKKAKKREAETALSKLRANQGKPAKAHKTGAGKGGNATLKRAGKNKPPRD